MTGISMLSRASRGVFVAQVARGQSKLVLKRLRLSYRRAQNSKPSKARPRMAALSLSEKSPRVAAVIDQFIPM